MVSKDSDRFKFNKNGTDFLTGSYIGYSSGSNDLNILDSKIELNQVEHFLKKEDMYARHEIIKNIYSSLKQKGLFLWDEPNVKSHWEGKKDIDGWGFSGKEMDKYAVKAGFKPIKQLGIYSKIPIINKPTLYMAGNIKNIWALEILEKMPFKKNNNIRIYCKE